MKTYAILVMALLVMAIMPIVLADSDGANIGIDVVIDEPDNSCPSIYQDNTQRSWFPNNQNLPTAERYGDCSTNVYGDEACQLDERGNYVFTGESLTYYAIVEDLNGASDIEDVDLLLDDSLAGDCAQIAIPTGNFPTGYSNWAAYSAAKYGVTWNANTMKLYRCQLIVGVSSTSDTLVSIQAEDEECAIGGTASPTVEDKEYLDFNPDVEIELEGTVSFAKAVPGSTALSTPVQVENEGETVLDTYIAASTYFTDPTDPDEAICPTGAGIHHSKFAYQARKGSINSGLNDNSNPGLGEDSGLCSARADEFTALPSFVGNTDGSDAQIGYMCRIMNFARTASFLSPGDDMSVVFKLSVPNPCRGTYTEGNFYVVGRVI